MTYPASHTDRKSLSYPDFHTIKMLDFLVCRSGNSQNSLRFFIRTISLQFGRRMAFIDAFRIFKARHGAFVSRDVFRAIFQKIRNDSAEMLDVADS